VRSTCSLIAERMLETMAAPRSLQRQWLWIPVLVLGAVLFSSVRSSAEVRELANRWIEACQRRDESAMRALFLPQGTYEDSVTGKPVAGAGHSGPWINLWRDATVWRFALERFVPLLDGGLVEWTAHARVGQTDLDFRGIALFGAHDGKIAWMRNYFDTRAFLKLLQPVPERGATP
jgi:limonene-1,2-epoxide hydrolase